MRLAQFIFSLLPLSTWRDSIHSLDGLSSINDNRIFEPPIQPNKSIAIVGAGSAGLAILKVLLDLPIEVRSGWDIVLYEQRRNVGGLWLPDPHEPNPPHLPETPLYPLLRTNTPHPTMTYPGFTFPPNTSLFPFHQAVEQYHVDYAAHYNLTSHIQLSHTVHAAGWRGSSTHGKWDIEIHRYFESDISIKHVLHRSFDHLIVANGHNHYPRVPAWNGTEEWLANSPAEGPKRELLHSIFYRSPEHYRDRTVVIVGVGASGRDAALQVSPIARATYQSLRTNGTTTPGANVIAKPEISHFTKNAIFFVDGSSLDTVDAVISATGYNFLVPFLNRAPTWSPSSLPGLTTDPHTQANSTTSESLITNLRYIFPLYRHIFSLSKSYPPTALSFIGLPVLIANCPSDIAQAIFVAQSIANSSVLPSREDMVTDLVHQENRLLERGYDPYVVGHKMVGGDDDAMAYQNDLVAYLKKKGQLPNDGKDYVEQWRRDARKGSFLLKRAWDRVEAAGEESKWLSGVQSEDEWAALMKRLADWQEEWEKEHPNSLGTLSLAEGPNGLWLDDYGLY
ncbi:FAD/NAD-P-binding domain-containing protein [Abortiporus biennis]|nr:FAD/NAD-P-binding domain-containing protein [Abortiporus biennis]